MKKLILLVPLLLLILVGYLYQKDNYRDTESVLGTKVDLDGDSKIDAQYLDTHASNHDVGGSDAVFPTDPGYTAYLQWDDALGDLKWTSVPGGGGDMLATNNLSDLTNDATARTNLGVAIGSDVQAYDADLADLADGSLTGTKVGFADGGGNFVATDVESAIEELTNAGGGPNASDYKVNWVQIGNMPAAFADGTDDGSGWDGTGNIDVSGSTNWLDDIFIVFGTSDDWTFGYDETTDDQLELKSNSAGDTTVEITNTGAGDALLVVDKIPLNNLVPPNGTDPDVSIAGEIASDTDDYWLRGYFNSAQRAIVTEYPITLSVAEPDQMDARDYIPFWTNNTGATITIISMYCIADDDDTDFRIEEYDADGASNEALVKAETCDTGSGPYTNDGQTTITNASVENGHILVFDADDTDTPDYVHCTLWYTVNADVD